MEHRADRGCPDIRGAVREDGADGESALIGERELSTRHRQERATDADRPEGRAGPARGDRRDEEARIACDRAPRGAVVVLRDAQCTDSPDIRRAGSAQAGECVAGTTRLRRPARAIEVHDRPDPADGEDIRRRRTPHGDQRLRRRRRGLRPEASIEEQDLAVVGDHPNVRGVRAPDPMNVAGHLEWERDLRPRYAIVVIGDAAVRAGVVVGRRTAPHAREIDRRD